jgi:dCMP deaminase
MTELRQHMSIRRPDKQLYFLLLAVAARTRADCLAQRVGAVISRDDRVLSTGYSGTPFGLPNCSEGGCRQCAQAEQGSSQEGNDVCLCVHAEQNAILTAARVGQPTLSAAITSTSQPCFGCLKEMVQAGIEEVRFLQQRHPDEFRDDPALARQYAALRERFRVFARIGDPNSDSQDVFTKLMGG